MGNTPVQHLTLNGPKFSNLESGAASDIGSVWGPKGETELRIPNGRAFRTWIGLAGSVTDADLIRRGATRRLGMLALQIEIVAQEIRHEMRV